MKRNALYLVAVMVIVAVAALYAYSVYRTGTSANASNNNVFVSLTDPANVPHGTTSLNVTYSGIRVHVSGGNSSGWTNVNGSGTLNLLSLINITTVLGALHLSNGSVINKVGFNITSASIDVNGTVSPVVLPSNKILANVSYSPGINGTVNIVTDLSPTIITILTVNSTVFIMVPSVRAVIVGSKTLHVGEQDGIPVEATRVLHLIKPNMSISSVSLSTLGNSSHISFTVTDNSNASATLKNFLIFGNFSTNLNISAIAHVVNVTETESGRANDGNDSNVSDAEQETETSITRSEASTVGHFRVLNFLFSSNGTLLLPFSQLSATAVGESCHSLTPESVFNSTGVTGESEHNANSSNLENSKVVSSINDCISNIGYVLKAQSSNTFSFNAPISMGFGRIIMSFVTGNNYMLTLQGEDGARVVTNSTAT